MSEARRPAAGRTLAYRLRPGDDLKLSLMAILEASTISAGVILSLVGSLSSARLRMAGGDSLKDFSGPLEIVSATGTIGGNACHIHVSIADGTGTTYGGHLVAGCPVFTTAELVILDLSASWLFDRVHDPCTGFRELSIAACPAIP